MTTDLVIYGMKGSPFVRKVQVLLAEKGVEYELEMLSPFPSPPDWYAAANPARRIPMLRDRSVGTEGADGTIPDSSAICGYLERRYPEPALYPKGEFDFGRALWIEEYADTVIAGPVGMGMFRPMVFPRMQGKEPDVERARKTLREDFPPIFDYMAGLIGDREFLLGGSFGIADIALATSFVNFHHAGGTIDAARWPTVHAYIERIHERPSFAACIADEKRMIPQVEAPL